MNTMIIAEFIKNIGLERNAKNILEVGVGYNYDVALHLKKYFNVYVLDINKKSIEKAHLLGLNGIVGDITKNFYLNVDLIYSIRLPYDLQKYCLQLSKKLKVPFILRPLSNEEPIDNLILKNYKGEVFYLFMP